MHTIIDSNIKIYNYSFDIYNWAITNLKVKNSLFEQYRKQGKIAIAIQNKIPKWSYAFNIIDNCIIFPFGLLNALWPVIKCYPYKYNFNSTDDISIKEEKCPYDLYDYQQEAIEAMVKAKGGVLVSGCGSGKTVMGTEIIHKIGKKFLWLTHTKSLLEQTYLSMKTMYPNMSIGKIMDGKVDFGQDGTIATVQTLSKVSLSLYANDFEVIVCDESAHTVGTKEETRAFTTLLDKIPARYKYGLTATPFRSDDLISTMYMYLGCSKKGLLEPTYQVPISKTKIIPAVHLEFALPTVCPPNAKIIKNGKIDYIKLINMLSADKKRNEYIVKNVVEMNKEDRIQIVLCHRIKHCYELTKLIEKEGINACCITSTTPSKKRDSILTRKTEWNVLVATYQLLKEGINIKELDTLHLVTPQADDNCTIQCAGRIERFLENKKQPLIFDYVDTNFNYCLRCFEKRVNAIKSRHDS